MKETIIKKEAAKRKLNNFGQAAMELAVFGLIVIYVMGSIVSNHLRFAYYQHMAYRTFREALMLSWEHSKANGRPPTHGKYGTTARNSSSVTVIEDRLVASLDKYGSIDRTPAIRSANATLSKQLFQPLDFGETMNLPVVDVIINNKHFVFAVASFESRTVAALSNPRFISACGAVFFTKTPNHVRFGFCIGNSPNCDLQFDIDHSGTLVAPAPDVANGLRSKFAWQWGPVLASTSGGCGYPGINVENNDNTALDVDFDGKEELIKGFNGSSFQYLDYQSGDLDLTEDSSTSGPKSGLQPDVNMYTLVKSDSGDAGTFYRIEEGMLFGAASGQYVRSLQKKDSVDFIERVIQLSADTGNFCRTDAYGSNLNPLYQNTFGYPNPVEACNDCFLNTNFEKTCFDNRSTIERRTKPVIYVRSRVQDLHGRKWVTNVSGDAGIDFDVPPIP